MFRTYSSVHRLAVGLVSVTLLCLILAITQTLQTAGRVNRVSQTFEATENQLSDFQNKLFIFEQELAASQKEIALLRDRRIPWQEVSSSLVAIGVEWSDSPNEFSYLWFGTGFAICDSELFATAAHVLHKAQSEHANLEKRGVSARVVVRFPSSAISCVKQVSVHPLFKQLDRNTDEPSYDLALFSADPKHAIARLMLAEHRSQEVGEELFVAGYPFSIHQIRYSLETSEAFIPTFRWGRLERLIDIDDLSRSSKRDLLQLNIPLVSGMSGAPIININGKVVGVAIFAVHRHIRARELQTPIRSLSNTIRILDPAHVSFAVSKTLIEEMLENVK